MTERARTDVQSATGSDRSLRPPTGSRSRHRVWTWAIVITTVVLSIGAGAALGGPGGTAPLDPDSPAPKGSMALAQILMDRGVAVKKVHTFAEASAADETQTLLIVNSPLISETAGLDLVGTAANRTVVVGAVGGAATLVKSRTDAEPGELSADCLLAEAQTAGNAVFSDQMISGASEQCFPGVSGAGLLFEGSLFVLADGSAMMNETLAESGNAALSLNLLSKTDRVIWFIPSPSDLALTKGDSATPTDLLPGWIAPVVIQSLLVFGVLAYWRSRRLGPLIREPLPIVVPAHETDEGYAGLLQRNGQAGMAAAALRQASIVRLTSLCGLPADPGIDVLADTLAARLGEPEEPISDILWQRPVTTDSGLAELHLELNRLEESTRLNRSTQNEEPTR